MLQNCHSYFGLLIYMWDPHEELNQLRKINYADPEILNFAIVFITRKRNFCESVEPIH